jgi:undecaprenyl-diphosphatase
MFTGATVIAGFFGPRVRVLFFSMAAVVGFSRVYVGAHYPLDVLAGAVLGITWGTILVWGWRLASAQGHVPLLRPREERA